MANPPDYVVPDASAPSESFRAVPTFNDVHTGDPYLFLMESLRTIDETQGTGVLKRWATRPRELWDRWQQKAWRVTKIQNPVMTPDVLAEHLLMLVGFGKGAGKAETVAKKLGKVNTRKLAQLAVPYWVRRGRRTALDASLRLVCGLRPAIDDWFTVRTLVDEWIIGMEGGPTDPWMIWSLRAARDAGGALATDDWAEQHVSIRIPSLVGDAEGQTLAQDICDLARPLGERYELAFVDFIDLFYEGVLSHWVKVGNVPEPTHSPGAASSNPVVTAIKLPGMVFADGARVRLAYKDSEDWDDYVWTGFIRFDAGYKAAGGIVELRFYVTDDGNCFVVRLDTASSLIRVGEYTAGVFAELDSKAFNFANTNITYGFGVETANYANNTRVQIRALWEGDVFLEVDTLTNGKAKGPVEIKDHAFTVGKTFEIHRTEVFQIPLTTALLKP